MAIHIEHLSRRYQTLRDSLTVGFYVAPGYRPRVRFSEG